MKRTGTNIALLFAVLLILGALWFRHNSTKKSELSLVAQVQPATSDTYNQILNDYFSASASTTASSTAPTTPLTDTDIIGRQLILDYVDLAASGKATDESVKALAEKYVGQIPSLNHGDTINIADLKTAFNNKANFQVYGDSFLKIERGYAEELNKATPTTASLAATQMSLTTGKISQAYTHAALELKGLTVPVALLPQHIQLINSYLQSAAATKAASESNTDSSKAFAGIISLNTNIDKEAALVTNIVQILKSNGVQI